MRGFIVGSLILIALEVFVTGSGPDKASGLLGWSATALDDLLSPDKPGIPQVKNTGAASSTTATPTSSTTTTPGGSTGVQQIYV